MVRRKPVSSDGFLSAEAYQGITREKDFQAQVIHRAQFLGWRVFYIPDWVWNLIIPAMAKKRIKRDWAAPGFPDLVMVRRGRLVLAECKTNKGILRQPQKDWGDDLKQVDGVEYYVWRPRDQDQIEKTLA